MRIVIIVFSVVALVAVGVFVRQRTHKPMPPTNVFLIVVDTLRPDRLSCYGYDAHETPNIDRLAAKGVRFARAHSAASWTAPSMGAILTSLYPTQLGLVEVDALPGEMLEWRVVRRQKSNGIPPDVPTLATLLGQLGFTSAAFVNQPALNVMNRFTRGFDEWFYPDSTGVVRHDPSLPISIKPDWAGTTARALEADSALVHEFEAWLRRAPEGGRFAWVHLLTPHAPYLPPKRYAPESSVASELYDGEVRAVDELVGEIFRAIDAHVGLDDALVVFVSDHGEAFGEHNMYEHGHTLHQEVTRVPLIIAAPSLKAGVVVETHVPVIDILPTIMELVGGPVPEGGRSLLGGLEDDTESRLIYSEGMLYGNTERSLLVDGFKIMFNGMNNRYALYDLTADPREIRDVSAGRRDLAAKMRAALDAMHARLDADYASRRDSLVATDESTDEELMKALRSLGYIK